jgi:hypothetical protein
MQNEAQTFGTSNYSTAGIDVAFNAQMIATNWGGNSRSSQRLTSDFLGSCRRTPV